MDEHNADTFAASDPQKEEMQEEIREQEQFVALPEDTKHPGIGSSYVTSDQWSWMQTEIGDLRAEQTRQGLEQARQGTLMEERHAMMQRLTLQFPPPQ